MAQKTIKIKAFNNAEIIAFNIVGQIKKEIQHFFKI